jgi:hypothetical protein
MIASMKASCENNKGTKRVDEIRIGGMIGIAEKAARGVERQPNTVRNRCSSAVSGLQRVQA